MKENSKLSDYVDILEIFINHHNGGNETPLTPKEIKLEFGMDVIPSKTTEYEQKKRSLDRCLEFYSLIKLISIKTDTTMNELGRLERERKNRFPLLEERKQLDPYINHIKDVRKKTLTKNKCDLFNDVGRFRKTVDVWIDGNKNEVDENILKQLPKYKEVIILEDISKEKNGPKIVKLTNGNTNPLSEYPTDKDGYSVVNEKMKFKKVQKQKLSFEFFGDKFQNIQIDISKDFDDSENKTKNFLKDTVIVDGKKITLVDVDDTSVRAEDCKYKLNLNDKCNIDNPIKFVLPSNTKIDSFTKFLIKNIDIEYNEDGELEEDITTDYVSTILNSNAFSNENKGFVANTVGKLLLEKHKALNVINNKSLYPFTLLINLIESNTKVNIEFENTGNIIKLNNTQIKGITIKENSFDLYFENFVSMNQTDISQIKLIDNIDKKFNIHKLNELIEEIENPTYKTIFKNMMEDFAFITILFESDI